MKVKTAFIFSSVFCAIVAVFSCNNNSSNTALIERKWAIDTFYSRVWDEQVAQIRYRIDTTRNESVKAALMQSLNTSLQQQKQETIQFNADNTLDEFIVMLSTPINLKGHWKFIDDDKMVMDVIPQKQTIKINDSTTGTLNVGEGQTADTFKISILTDKKMMIIGNGKQAWNGTIVLKPAKQ